MLKENEANRPLSRPISPLPHIYIPNEKRNFKESNKNHTIKMKGKKENQLTIRS